MVTTVATPGGVVRHFGNVRVLGVAAGGVEVGLAFPHPAGSTTGRLLPTGLPVDVLESDGRSYRASMVDAGAPCAFFDEHDVPLDAETLDLDPHDLDACASSCNRDDVGSGGGYRDRRSKHPARSLPAPVTTRRPDSHRHQPRGRPRVRRNRPGQ